MKLTTVAALLVAVGLLIWWQNRTGPEPAEAPVAASAPATAPAAQSDAKPAAEAEAKPPAESATESAAESGTESATESAAATKQAATPEFDVVRVSPEGQAVIAGRASPGQTVEILLDGAVIGSATADPQGAFAAVLEIAPSDAARTLVLRAGAAEGGETVVAAPAQETAGQAAAGKEAAEKEAAGEDAAAKAVTGEAPASTATTAEAGAGKTSGDTGTAQPAAEPGAVAAAGGGSEPAGSAVSTPVIILPQANAEQAPVLVKPEAEDVTLLQPAAVEPVGRIVLDRITYSHTGALVAAGRGRPGTLVRVYVNAEFFAEVRSNEVGLWHAEVAADVAAGARLLRFDEVDASGKVLSRLETPFEYSPSVTTHEVRQRKIEVQKGDYLWKFAEQYYGEGWRYSVIFSANSALIRNPDLIYPGQVFTIPELVNSQ